MGLLGNKVCIVTGGTEASGRVRAPCCSWSRSCRIGDAVSEASLPPMRPGRVRLPIPGRCSVNPEGRAFNPSAPQPFAQARAIQPGSLNLAPPARRGVQGAGGNSDVCCQGTASLADRIGRVAPWSITVDHCFGTKTTARTGEPVPFSILRGRAIKKLTGGSLPRFETFSRMRMPEGSSV